MPKRFLRAAVFALGALLLAAPAFAHEKWYTDAGFQGPIPEIFRTPTVFSVVAILCALALFFICLAVDRKFDGSKTAKRVDGWLLKVRLSPRVILGALVGVSLLGAGLHHTLFSPSLPLPGSAYGTFLGIAQMLVGVLMLFFEPILPELAVALIALFLFGLPVMPFWDLMEELLLVGAAVFMITSETNRLPWKRWNRPEVRRLGYQAFRMLAGLNFLILASVKWVRPDLGVAVVERFNLNFMAGVGVDAASFVFVAAIIETIVALCILFRVAYRPAIAAAFAVFTLSIFVLDYKELLGHLPIKASLLLLFVYGHWHRGEKKEETA